LLLPAINSHNSWSRLEECWLGDVYPTQWYEHLEPEIRDVFQRLTEITQQDLKHIQQTLESHDITVRRPTYSQIDDFIDIENDQLIKPQITPRDYFIVAGNDLYNPAQDLRFAIPWRSAIQQYKTDKRCKIIKNYISHIFNGANVVRAGKDIVIDTIHDSDKNNALYQQLKTDYRLHWEKNGGHMDGCFAILKPGLILASHYFNGYNRNFPGWEIIYLNNPTYLAHQNPYSNGNGKFWDTTVGTNRTFNEHVIKYAQDWVGNYTETYFELNCLVIDERNVVMLAENEKLAEDLARRGITVHWVPFRTRSFWDGAMHCLTLDIRRQSTIEDFFPARG
jgi:N-dimethylarginine dimethylaminohydrolase